MREHDMPGHPGNSNSRQYCPDWRIIGEAVVSGALQCDSVIKSTYLGSLAFTYKFDGLRSFKEVWLENSRELPDV